MLTDYRGKPLEIGDAVTVTVDHYKGMVSAEVIGFTPKKIRVQYIDRWKKPVTLLKEPYTVVKLNA